MNNYYEVFKDLLANKIIQTKNTGELLDIVRASEEAIPAIPNEDRAGFVLSYADYHTAIDDCRKIKKMNFKNAERVELMIGVRELPYPFTCVVETSKEKMNGLDAEFVAKNNELSLKDDEIGIRNIAQLIAEKQSIIRRETWEIDPPLWGFTYSLAESPRSSEVG
jgi:hypothetical protein